MRPIHVLVLGPDRPDRRDLERTLARLGSAVMASAGTADLPAAGEVVMLDLREADECGPGLREGLMADPRPLVIVAERPGALPRELGARPGPTLAITDVDSDAGCRVALAVCRGLDRVANGRPAPAGIL